MQNDLISRSALIEQLKKENAFYNPHINEIIVNMPTAYDVEEVVRQLEDKTLETLGVTKEQFQMDKNEYKGYCSLSLHEAESVIRNGGKE